MIRTLLRIAIATYVGLGIVLVVSEPRLVYYPDIVPVPDFGQCPELADAVATVHEGARFYYRAHADERMVIMYPGNAGSVCDRAEFADVISRAGYAYVLVEYPGYGNDASASPSRELILQQTAFIRDFVEQRGYRDVTLLGESIGVGVAAYHASMAPPERLIFVSPYYELADMAGLFRYIYPVRTLMRENYTPGAYLEGVTAPAVLVRAERDEIIPRASAERLLRALAGDVSLHEIPGATHNSLYERPELYEHVSTVLSEAASAADEVVH